MDGCKSTNHCIVWHLPLPSMSLFFNSLGAHGMISSKHITVRAT
jgi:hypothetical protein